MSGPETNFDGVSESFAEYAETVRGYVRYEVAHRNLEDIVLNKPLRVADIGGGAAIDAVWLAGLGHEVVLVEPSEEQLEIARKTRLPQLPGAIREKIETKNSTAENLLRQGEAGKFDLVLSHGVAMYVPNPELFVEALVQLVKPGGYVSLLEKGYVGAELRLIRRKQLKELEALREGENQANEVNRTRQAFHPEDLEAMLLKAGAKVLRWSGVRIDSDEDKRPIHTVPKDELEAIVATEYLHGKAEALRIQGQMLHFIAQKQ